MTSSERRKGIKALESLEMGQLKDNQASGLFELLMALKADSKKRDKLKNNVTSAERKPEFIV